MVSSKSAHDLGGAVRFAHRSRPFQSSRREGPASFKTGAPPRMARPARCRNRLLDSTAGTVGRSLTPALPAPSSRHGRNRSGPISPRTARRDARWRASSIQCELFAKFGRDGLGAFLNGFGMLGRGNYRGAPAEDRVLANRHIHAANQQLLMDHILKFTTGFLLPCQGMSFLSGTSSKVHLECCVRNGACLLFAVAFRARVKSGVLRRNVLANLAAQGDTVRRVCLSCAQRPEGAVTLAIPLNMPEQQDICSLQSGGFRLAVRLAALRLLAQSHY